MSSTQRHHRHGTRPLGWARRLAADLPPASSSRASSPRSSSSAGATADGGHAFGEARLAELFAAGEISEDEYRHRLTVLKEQQP